MAKKVKTQSTSIGDDHLFLEKARHFLDGADAALRAKNWEASASLGVHAIISSCDAVTAALLGLRHAGPDHKGLLDVLATLPGAYQPELKGIKRRISQVLANKTSVEYDVKPVRAEVAKTIVREARHVFGWANKHVV